MASHSLTLNSAPAIGYPEGQSVALYPVSNWGTPEAQRDPSGAVPVGSSTATASVSSGNIAFGSVADGDYWAYASVGGNRIYRLVHVGGPDPSGDIAHLSPDQTFAGVNTFTQDPAIPSLPTAGQKAALAGSSGTPAAGNKYVTDADARNSDTRTPTDLSVTTAKLAANAVTAAKASTGTGATNLALGSDAENAFATYKPLLIVQARVPAGQNAATLYPAPPGSSSWINGANVSAGFAIFYFDPADYTAGSRTTKLRLRMLVVTNDVAPTCTITSGLYSGFTVGGAAAVTNTITGSPALVTGSDGAVVAAPAADSVSQATTADFTAPAAGALVPAIVTSVATTAANSSTIVRLTLSMRQV